MIALPTPLLSPSPPLPRRTPPRSLRPMSPPPADAAHAFRFDVPEKLHQHLLDHMLLGGFGSVPEYLIYLLDLLRDSDAGRTPTWREPPLPDIQHMDDEPLMAACQAQLKAEAAVLAAGWPGSPPAMTGLSFPDAATTARVHAWAGRQGRHGLPVRTALNWLIVWDQERIEMRAMLLENFSKPAVPMDAQYFAQLRAELLAEGRRLGLPETE